MSCRYRAATYTVSDSVTREGHTKYNFRESTDPFKLKKHEFKHSNCEEALYTSKVSKGENTPLTTHATVIHGPRKSEVSGPRRRSTDSTGGMTITNNIAAKYVMTIIKERIKNDLSH